MRSRSVLIVDDDPAVLKALTLMVERLGCRVLSTCGASAALDVARVNAVDLIICDVRLPERPGPQLVDQLRDIGIKAPVLFISGDPSAEQLEDALGVGRASFLAKPFSLAELQDAMTASISAA